MHVCRRWRRIVLESPGHLHLLLPCNGNTPTKNTLPIWPPFPISITCFPWHTKANKGVENVIVALKCHDRVSEITLDGIDGPILEKFATAMQEPFPALTYLRLSSQELTKVVLPDTFLGGSAPRMRSFALLGIPFPAFPQLALSAKHLLSLRLWDIPDAGYISPENMANCLAELPDLEALSIGFLTFRSGLVQKNSPPSARIFLRSLTYFAFRGHGAYLEDLRARVDIPPVNKVEILYDIF